jgi:hypothetical protein
MLTVYLDESGQQSHDYVVIAGFVGTDDQWNAFSHDWQKGLGKKQALHMCELYWNNPRTEGLLAALGPIPRKHGLTPVVGAVRVSDYLDLLSNPVEQMMMCGYNCALYPVIISILKHFPSGERVKWVFEEQHHHEAAARTVFERFTELNFQQRLAGVEFVAKNSTIRTQPSDYLAYAVAQRLRDRTSRKAKWSSPILEGREPLGLVVDRDTIRKIVGFVNFSAGTQTFLETGKRPSEISKDFRSKGEVNRTIARLRKERSAK